MPPRTIPWERYYVRRSPTVNTKNVWSSAREMAGLVGRLHGGERSGGRTVVAAHGSSFCSKFGTSFGQIRDLVL
jgi:hypothetical protein